MSTTDSQLIPDLWPKEIVFKPVLSPLTILRHQARILGEKSLGMLVAEVGTDDANRNFTTHELRLIAPALDGYTRPLLSVEHSPEFPYPCKLVSEGRSQVADSPGVLMDILSKALASPTTRSLIYSLLVRISEKASTA
jgi:hypothetical protein